MYFKYVTPVHVFRYFPTLVIISIKHKAQIQIVFKVLLIKMDIGTLLSQSIHPVLKKKKIPTNYEQNDWYCDTVEKYIDIRGKQLLHNTESLKMHL